MTPERLVELTGNPMIARLLDEIMALKVENLRLRTMLEELRLDGPRVVNEAAERDAQAYVCRVRQQRIGMRKIVQEDMAEGNR